jgi:large conductance mechanosensitive channel
MLKEFRDFVSKGNVIDLAIGIIIGAAFTAIVTSFVKDILTPLIGVLGKANFDNLFYVLKPGTDPTLPGPYTTVEAAQKAGAVTMNYGTFLDAVINFLLVAMVLFIIVKAVNKMRVKHPQDPIPVLPPEPTKEEQLLTEIRDLLKK